MDCQMNAEHLTGFHFGSISGMRREQVEQHLLGCRQCLETFMSLKRDIEATEGAHERPSLLTRRRIFQTAQQVFLQKAGPSWGVNSRRVFLAGFAVAAAVILLIFAKDHFQKILPRGEIPVTELTKNMDAMIDAGGLQPRHINTL